MSSKLNSTHYEVPSYQFVTDPNYDETLSGRVRAACITCSRRKIKCSGGVPCETCLSHNRRCEGLKKVTRWEKRRKPAKKRTSSSGSLPSNARGIVPGEDRTVKEDKHDREAQDLVNAHVQQINTTNSFIGHGGLLEDHSALGVGYDDAQQSQSQEVSEQPVSTVRKTATGIPSPKSWPNSPPIGYRTPALNVTEMFSDYEGLGPPHQFDQSLYTIPVAACDADNASSFIFAAECLEHQARILRLRALGQRHNSIDMGHLSSPQHPLLSSEIQFSATGEAMRNTDITVPSFHGFEWSKTGSVNVVSSEVEEEQSWATYELPITPH